MSKQYTWICFHCKKGVLGPSRPRMDNLCRYCLPCSQKQGKLIHRSSPVLERERSDRKKQLAQRRKKQTAAKRRAKEKQQEKNKFTPIKKHNDMDLSRETHKLWTKVKKVVAKNRHLDHLYPQRHIDNTKLRLDFYRCNEKWYKDSCWGRAGGSGWMRLRIGMDAKDSTVLATILHELIHMVARDHHGRTFKAIFAECAEIIYGCKVDMRHRYSPINQLDKYLQTMMEG